MDVKTLCLGVLTFGDATGYDIKKYFEDAFSHFFVAGFGSIYPALAELAGEGLVTCREESGAAPRPARKIYRITAAGRSRFLAALAETSPRHKVRSEFFVLLYFAHLLEPQRLAAVIGERLEDVQHDLELIDRFEAECPESPAGIRFAAGLGRAILETTRSYIAQHAGELLAERAHGAPARGPAGTAMSSGAGAGEERRGAPLRDAAPLPAGPARTHGPASSRGTPTS